MTKETPVPSLTKEEHIARAMLLGYKGYNFWLGYYYRQEAGGFVRLDVKTLEPVSPEEQRRRVSIRDTWGSSEYARPWYDD